MKKVLVTGSKGFIGKAVCDYLKFKGAMPVHFDGDQDVRNRMHVSFLGSVDAIINLAGVLGTSETVGDELRAAEVNIIGALNIMDIAHRRNLPLVQIATGHEGQLNPYAITKKCATDLALSRAKWDGQAVNVVRAYHVYGDGQKMCAPHGPSKVRKIIPSFVARALTGMPLEINGDGMQTIDLVYIGDVAKALVDALFSPYGRVIEAGTGVATTVLAAANDVIKACDSKSKIVHVPMRKGEPEGSSVVATDPSCKHAWPYKLSEVVDGYRDQIERKVPAEAGIA